MKKRSSILTVATSFLLLSACSSGPGGMPPPDLTFQNVIPVSLPVTSVDIERASGYNAAGNAPDFIVPFTDKVEAYVRRKMQAVGGDKRLRVVIEDSSVKQHFETSANKVADFLDVAGFDVYDLSLVMNVVAEDPYGGTKGVRLKLGRTIKVSEHDSVAERELRQTEGTEALFRELDSNITRITLQELDLIPYQQGNGASSLTVPADQGGLYNGGAAPRVITGGPSTGGGASSSSGAAGRSTGASTGAIERQEL